MKTRIAIPALLGGLLVGGCGVQSPVLVEYRVPGTGAAADDTATLPRPTVALPSVRSTAPQPWEADSQITKTPLPPPEKQGRAVAAAIPPPSPPPASPASTASPAIIVVQRGDTVYAVARRYNFSVRGLIDANSLSPPYKLIVGQSLTLPRERVHKVKKGDTVYGLSRRYGTDTRALVRANGLAPPYRLIVGQRLRVPNSAIDRLIAETASSSALAGKAPSAGAGATDGGTRIAAVARKTPTVVPEPPPRTKGLFLWPVVGKVTSGFGAKANGLHNDGVNIAAGRGDAVRAAEDGVVVYSGNELRGYGNLVLVRHAGGWTSAYAHNETLLVGRGDTVRRGQIIARVGATGNVSTPQTHFELRRGSRAVDPIKYLAKN